jgi:hypothetical protein
MIKHLRLALVLLVATVMALLWTVPAVAEPVPPTAAECLAETPPASCGQTGGDAAPDVPELLDVPDSPVLPDEPALPDEPTLPGPAPIADEGPVTGMGAGAVSALDTANSRIAAFELAAVDGSAADPADLVSAGALPVDFTQDDLEAALEELGITGLDDEQLAALFELLQAEGPPPFCEVVDIPELCGDAPACLPTDTDCAPPISCDQFALLFGFDDCESIPLCIPRPPGAPEALPSPPFCAPTPGTGGTPPGYDYGDGYDDGYHDGYYDNCTDDAYRNDYEDYDSYNRYGSYADCNHHGTDDQQPAAYLAPTAAPVVTPAASSGQLAYTGVDVELFVVWGAALTLAGALLTLSARREA